VDQSRDELLFSNVKGRNPFKDVRVRRAFALAIDEDAIVKRVLRGMGRPTWLMYGPGVNGYETSLDHRPAVDPAKAKSLLAEAGYPEAPSNWWTPLLSSGGSGKVSNEPGTASFYG